MVHKLWVNIKRDTVVWKWHMEHSCTGVISSYEYHSERRTVQTNLLCYIPTHAVSSLTEWLLHWMTTPLNEYFTEEYFTECVLHWMGSSLNDYFTEWVLHWINTSLNGYFTEWVLH